MSVFHKLYTEAIEKTKEQNKFIFDLEKFDFFLIYMTSLVSSFKWKKTPVDNMPLFKPEQFIQQSGRLGLFNYENKWHILPIFPNGTIEEYGEYSDYIAVDCTGKNYMLKKDDLCICYNNSFCVPYYSMVKRFSDKSALALRAVDVSLAKAIAPTLVGVSSQEQLDIIGEMAQSINNPVPYKAMIKGKFDAKELDRVPAFDNREVDVLALWDVYVRYRNLYYGTIGINNIEIAKRERLTEAEGSGNDEIVRYSLFDDMWEQRQDFIKRAKEKFNVDIEIEINRDVDTVYSLLTDNEDKIDAVEMETLKGVNLGGNNEEEEEEDVNNE